MRVRFRASAWSCTALALETQKTAHSSLEAATAKSHILGAAQVAGCASTVLKLKGLRHAELGSDMYRSSCLLALVTRAVLTVRFPVVLHVMSSTVAGIEEVAFVGRPRNQTARSPSSCSRNSRSSAGAASPMHKGPRPDKTLCRNTTQTSRHSKVLHPHAGRALGLVPPLRLQ